MTRVINLAILKRLWGLRRIIGEYRFRRATKRALRRYGRVIIDQPYSEVELRLVRSGLLLQPPVDKGDGVR